MKYTEKKQNITTVEFKYKKRIFCIDVIEEFIHNEKWFGYWLYQKGYGIKDYVIGEKEVDIQGILDYCLIKWDNDKNIFDCYIEDYGD